MENCVVTGLGMVCGLGGDVRTCWDAALRGERAFGDVTVTDTSECYAHKGAEVRCDLPEHDSDRCVRLCLRAAEEALADAGINLANEDRERVGVILGSCVGGAASIERYYRAATVGDPADIDKMSASAITDQVALYFGTGGVTANIVNACAAGTMSIAYAADLIRMGKVDICISGGTDAFSSLAFSGFHALHALDGDVCSPFNRSEGITLGEGSGVLILESAEHAAARGARVYCVVAGSGVSSDAYHITAPRPDGAGQISAITAAVKNAGISFTDVDYVNAHGTGTAKNDETELRSLKTLFAGNDHVSVSSTKSMTGHCLGAAGSIEAVFAVKSIAESAVPPTAGFTPEEELSLAEKSGSIDFVANKGREKPVECAMSNSFAFGGTNASIVFAKSVDTPAPLSTESIYITGIGAVNGFMPDNFADFGVKPAFYRKLDRFSSLALIGGLTALRDAGLEITAANENDVGIIIGTADGPMTEIADFQKNIIVNGTEKGSAFAFPNTVYNAAGGYLSIFTGIKGYSATVANGAQAGLQSVCYAADVLKKGAAKVMLAMGVDEYSDAEKELFPERALAEGAVGLVLETASQADFRGAKKYAELAGYAAAHRGVPYGKYSGSENAVTKAVLAACADAEISPEDVDGIFSFSNGVPEVDDISKKILGEIFKGKNIPMYSACLRGDARAASSAKEAAMAAKALENGNWRYTLAVSLGTGGCASAVVMKRVYT